MPWDNSRFDAAFDRIGVREEVTLIKGAPPYLTFQARFDRPQQIVLDGEVHTTEYSIECTTSDVPNLKYHDVLMIGGARYRLRNPPLAQGDGYWTRASLELI